MKSIVLIRHGQSKYQVEGLTSGWTDTDLTELGQRQAVALASRLKEELGDIPFQIYCSDLKRAFQTAQIVGNGLGLELHQEPKLREWNNGVAAGKSVEEAKAYALERTHPLLDWEQYPQAETWREFHSRVADCIAFLTKDQENPLLLITHGGTIQAILWWWLGFDLELLSSPSALFKIYFEASPASITVLRVNEWSERAIERLNDSAHLHAEGLSEGTNVHPETG